MRMKKGLVTVQEHTEDAAKSLTEQILTLAQRFHEQIGPNAGAELVSTFVKTFVGASTYTVLCNEAEKGSKTQADADRAIGSYAAFKMEMQDAIASGFADAMFQFSGRNMDFYCQISPVPEPINTKPC